MSSVRVPLLEFSFASATPRLAFTKKISDKPLLVTTETAQNIFYKLQRNTVWFPVLL